MKSRPRRRSFQMIRTNDAPEMAPKLQHETEQPIRAPSFAADVLGVGLLSASFAGLAGWAFSSGDIMTGVGWGSVVGCVVVVWRAFRVLDRPVADWEQIVYQDVTVEPEPPTDDERLVVIIPNPNGGSVEFEQPNPAEFPNWASAVMRDLRDPQLGEAEKTSFSQNTAVRRGWPIAMYKSMIGKFETVGWVERRRNMAPRLTRHGEIALAAYVRAEPMETR